MRVTIRTITIPGGKGRAALHKALVYATTEQEAAPLMASDWSQREPEVFMAAQTWARRHTYIVSNPRTGAFYGSPAAR
jgi:hypothetical protein